MITSCSPEQHNTTIPKPDYRLCSHFFYLHRFSPTKSISTRISDSNTLLLFLRFEINMRLQISLKIIAEYSNTTYNKLPCRIYIFSWFQISGWMTENNGNSKLKPSHLLPLRYIQGMITSYSASINHVSISKFDSYICSWRRRFMENYVHHLLEFGPCARTSTSLLCMYFFYFVLGATLKTKTNPLSTR